MTHPVSSPVLDRPSGGGASSEGLGGVRPEVPYLRLPRAVELFALRANRLRALAKEHAAAGWLEALAAIAAAQQEAVGVVTEPLDPRALRPATPLCAREWKRSDGWRAALAIVLERLAAAPLPAPARDAVLRLRRASVEELELLATTLLSHHEPPVPAATLPFLAAGLQAYFTALAERLGGFAVEASSGGCPVCRSPPVAAVIQGDDKVRYLRCGLCSADWHVVRVQCVTCGSGARLSYAAIDGAAPGCHAEVCGECRTYLKLFSLEELPGAEPLADDAASLALDVLLGEEGYSRAGVNLLVAAPTSGRASATPNLQA